jgi:hypothetical protein
MFAASVFGAGVAALRAVPLVQGLTRTCVRCESMFFAKKFCHRWCTADSAFAFAHHFYLPPTLPGHVRAFLHRVAYFLFERNRSDRRGH